MYEYTCTRGGGGGVVGVVMVVVVVVAGAGAGTGIGPAGEDTRDDANLIASLNRLISQFLMHMRACSLASY